MKYKKRICDNILEKKLNGLGAVLIEGAKWCGKTSTAQQKSKTAVYMHDPDKRSYYLELADVQPSALLKGKTPVLIDEWQDVPKIWDAVRFEVDRRGGVSGQFILTGSATPVDKSKIMHSGIGRISRMFMRPMSLYESGDSSGGVSLNRLFESKDDIFSEGGCNIDELAYLICRGGWPGTLDKEKSDALSIPVDYVDGLVDSDMPKVIGENIDKDKLRKLLKSYSRNIGSQIKLEEIKKDVIGTDEGTTLGITTLYKYLDGLRNSFIIEDAPHWNPKLRSKTAIRSTPTRYFVDPSIAVACMGIGPGDLVKDLETMGFFFENMVIRDLRVYAGSMDGEVFHYLDRDKLECDAVIHLRNGKYALVEIKLGGDYLIEKGVESLKKLEKKLDTEYMNPPAFKMVITGVAPFAYRRKDGIYVVPITTLKN